MNHNSIPADDPTWYKDAIFYEVRVRSFFDRSGDGVGDFPGLTAKLDYIRDLGVTAVWLLPFYPSPLRDDGYDISDYMQVHPDCGTRHDFKVFLREAHRRGLRVVTELVLNHTSDQHPWFQRARRAAPGDAARDFYVWSDTTDRYRDARIIFQDFELSNWSWDPIARAYYWHRFFAHQPDLNYANPAVRKAIFKVLDFWLGMGIDGFRLDAVAYLCEREGTSRENLPETHAFLRELRAHIDRRFRDRMLLAEANQWPEDAVTYLAEGKECQMAFHFPLMPRIFVAVRMEDRFPLTDIWAQTPAIDETCQWALFLRNHDELTLETVTDEERDLRSDPERILSRFAPFVHQRITAARIRCHGDLHLSQMLYTGTDFVIIDFEGEAARPLSERRRKRAAMRDVAGMLRSFQRVAIDTLNERIHAGALGACDFAAMAPWLELWQTWTTWAFLKEYFALVDAAPFMPRDRVELRILLDTFVLERMLLELSAELVNRPDHAGIPLYGIEQFLGVDRDEAHG